MELNSLAKRARALTGLKFGELAERLGVSRQIHKGWAGQLLERALQAEAGSKPLPDFPTLGIELKTLPLDERGYPKESTFVCSINLRRLTGQQWTDSLVHLKLSHVLWIPIEARNDKNFYERKIGRSFFWKPNESEEMLLKTDWLELTGYLQTGQMEQVTSSLGRVLQVRPKAQNAKALTRGVDDMGQPCQTLPRGFYLRPSFTKSILDKAYTLE